MPAVVSVKARALLEQLRELEDSPDKGFGNGSSSA
jgi:hypothetical protein